MIDFPVVGTKLEPVAESWSKLVSASFPPIPMAARSENNRERNGDEGNPPRQGLRSGRKKGTRDREREGERERVEVGLVLRLETRTSFRSLFSSSSLSLSFSLALSRSLESRGHESTHNPSTYNNSTRFLRSDTEPRMYASLNKRYRNASRRADSHSHFLSLFSRRFRRHSMEFYHSIVG